MQISISLVSIAITPMLASKKPIKSYSTILVQAATNPKRRRANMRDAA
jgi:hypothetical protein